MGLRDHSGALTALVAVLLIEAAGSHSCVAATRAPDPLESAKAAIRLKDYSRAATELERAAAGGNADAQYLLGTFALNGLVAERDTAKAKVWLEKAAANGHARAAYSLAALLANADPPDEAGARKWLEKSRTLGLQAAERTQARGALPLAFAPKVDLIDARSRREALWLAAERGDLGTLQSLADKATVSARDEFGRGALARAAATGQSEAAAALLRVGAAVDSVDERGVTPLMLAASAGSAPAIDVLVRAGARSGAADQAGNNALMYAARSGNVDAVNRLLEAGADIASRDVQGWSALDFARSAGKPEVEALLKARGATGILRTSIASATVTSV